VRHAERPERQGAWAVARAVRCGTKT
jgi:hypothetical protein